MRTLRLAQVAAQAERLRLQGLARRLARRGLLVALGAVFVLAALVSAHLALVLVLSRWMAPEYAALCVAGGDLLLAALFVYVAVWRSGPDRIERDAAALRDQALAPLREAATVGRMVLQAEGLWAKAILLLGLWLRAREPKG